MDILGTEIGGSGMKAAPLNPVDGSLAAARTLVPIPRPAAPDAVAGAVKKIIDSCSWAWPIGCGQPAVVRNGIVCTAANVDQAWIGVDAKALLFKRNGVDITILNDANDAGLAEMQGSLEHPRLLLFKGRS